MYIILYRLKNVSWRRQGRRNSCWDGGRRGAAGRRRRRRRREGSRGVACRRSRSTTLTSFANYCYSQAEKRGERQPNPLRWTVIRIAWGGVWGPHIYCLWKKSRRVAGIGIEVGEEASAMCHGLSGHQHLDGAHQSYLTRLPFVIVYPPVFVDRAAKSIKYLLPLSFVFDEKALKKCFIPFSRIYNKKIYFKE